MKLIKTVSFRTLGCRLNHSESDSIQYNLTRRGLRAVSCLEPADLTVINSCAVTRQAEAKTRGAIAASRRISPGGKIAVIGCCSHFCPDKLMSLPGVDLVLGNCEKYNLYEYVPILECGGNGIYVSPINGYGAFSPIGVASSGSRTRAFMKVQDGCDYKCTFCIIPFLRGKARSRKIEACIEEAKLLEDLGFQEIVLTGVNVGSYKGEDGKDLCDLIELLLRNSGIKRLRISSIEPDLVSDRLINMVKNEKRLCRHFHIPLQHGSDEILESMHRNYCIKDFKELTDKLSREIPEVCIGTDVLVGFPGESEENFVEMYEFLERAPFSYLHVFRFSPRVGTVASGLKDNITPNKKKCRSSILRNLSCSKKRNFLNRFLDKTAIVLFEKRIKDECLIGLTDNYIRVKAVLNRNFINELVKVKLKRVNSDSVEGEIISE